MSRPENLKIYQPADLKLGIKSSLPNAKSTIALLIALWESLPEKVAVVNYSKQQGDGIVVSDASLNDLNNYFQGILNQFNINQQSFLNVINSNQLFKSQIESLIVAFELVWKLAEVNFVNANYPASYERTGGKRYEKKMTYSSNIDLINAVIAGNEEEYKKVLASWLGLNSVSIDQAYETRLLQALTAISESAVFKMIDGNDSIIFNQDSIYKKILSSNDSIDISGDEEPKGSLRILKSIVSDDLNSHLNNDNGNAGTADSVDKLREYEIRVATFHKLSSVDLKSIVNENNDEGENEDDFDNCSRLAGGENVILFGVPGAGKSWTIQKEYCDQETIAERVVFHPDYTYGDFVGQILPKSENGDVSYPFSPGPFTRVLKKAYTHPNDKHILIIEEINRGNAPAVFGDIFQLLDRTDTGESEYSITNADIAKEVYGDENHKVKLPSNLSIICTMNTSDQNVFTLDTAFQRRWNMRLIENMFRKEDPDEKAFAEHKILDTNVTWEQFVKTINAEILNKNNNVASSEDKRLGTHFINLSELEINLDEFDNSKSPEDKKKAALMNRRFPEKVIKYLWDDAFKFYRDEIFIADLKCLEDVIMVFSTNQGNNRFNVFKDTVKQAIENQQ